MSEATAKLIDREIRRLVEDGDGGPDDILTDNRDELDASRQALLEYETLTGDEIGADAARRAGPRTRAAHEPPSAAAPERRQAGSVPAGTPKRGTGGVEPSPQPGA